MLSARERLRKWRGSRSQAEVAELLEVEQARVSKLESGKYRRPSLTLALRIQEVTGIPAKQWDRPTDRTGTEG